MVRVVAILAGIFLAAYLAVHLGYARLEKELLNRSCCGIAELPIPEAVNRVKGEKLNKSHAPRTPLSPEEQSANNENLDFQVIIRRNIFQLIQKEQLIKTEQEPVAVQETVAEEVPTKLNLTLLGTVLGDDQTSRAIILAEKQKEQKLYRVGDAVQGAIIESIERGKVILDVFGTKETLTMKKRKGGGPGAPNRSSARMSRPVPRPAPDLMEDEIEEVDEDDLVEEKKVQARRRPPSIRPHRRINFRRNPIRSTPDVDAEEEDLVDEEELLPLD